MAQLQNTNFELEAPLRPLGSEEESRTPFPKLLILLAKRKVFVLVFVGLAAVSSIVVSLLLPKTFTASTRLMPPQQNQSLSAASMLNQLGGALGAIAGQGLGLHSTGEIYVSMLHSRAIADAMIDRFSLMSLYGQKLRSSTRQKLESRTEVILSKDGTITISVEDRDPQRAADIANAYVDELTKLTKTLAVSEAGKRRIFFEREVKLASDDLAAAEVALKQTQLKTGLILLDSQSRAMIDAVAGVRARIASQEVMVQSMRSFATDDNPELVRAVGELDALHKQLSRLEGGGGGNRSFTEIPVEKVPTEGLEYVRKLRDVKYREALFELLAKQYEIAKIDEAKDSLIVQQLDSAIPPDLRTSPKRGVIVMIGTFLALALAILIVLLMEKVEEARNDPQFLSRWETFKFYLFSTHKS